jgi:hypothetical protein
VLLRTTEGELAGTVREARRLPDGRTLFLIKLDAGVPRRRVVLAAQLRPAPAGPVPGGPGPGGRPCARRGWTPAELALLGTAYDGVIAAKLGRSVAAVRGRRAAMKIPVFRDRRGRKPPAAG